MEIMVNIVFKGRTAPLLRPLLLSLLLIAALLFPCTPTLQAQVPVGVSYLANSDRASLQSVLDNPSVDGLSIRVSWSTIETSDGVYDWSFIDSEVAKAAASGKWVLLRVVTMAGRPQWLTDAIVAAGGKFFTWTDTDGAHSCPVLWDPVFVAKKTEMLANLGARYGNNPTIKILAINFANCTSEDWNIPHLPENIADWLALGYDTYAMLDVWKQFLDTVMAGFPNTYVALAINSNGHTGVVDLDPDANYLARNAILYANLTYPGRLIVQKNGFSATTTAAPGGDGTNYELLYDAYPNSGGQMLFSCSNDPTWRMNGGVPGDPATILHNSVNIALGYRLKYLEIYQLDCVSLTSEITYAHNMLQNAPTPTPTPSATPPAAPTELRVVP